MIWQFNLSMKVFSAEFVKSATSVKACPTPVLPEYAFIGRSNVGKSSLINMLAVRKNLAKTSGTPGKTRLINHFLINNSWYLCDLPGYGFAKISKSIREKWEQTIKNYLLHRENLLCAFILIDIRHEPLNNDLDFLSWMGMEGVPFAIVFTKADKLSKAKVQQQLAQYEKKLAFQWEPLPPVYVSSSLTGKGREDILELIEATNKKFNT